MAGNNEWETVWTEATKSLTQYLARETEEKYEISQPCLPASEPRIEPGTTECDRSTSMFGTVTINQGNKDLSVGSAQKLIW
jgi:hypothetical protein